MKEGRRGTYQRTRDRLPLLRELRAQGKSFREIAPIIGLSVSGVHSICLRYGLKKPRKSPPWKRLPGFPGVLALARARLQQVKSQREEELRQHWQGAA